MNNDPVGVLYAERVARKRGSDGLVFKNSPVRGPITQIDQTKAWARVERGGVLGAQLGIAFQVYGKIVWGFVLRWMGGKAKKKNLAGTSAHAGRSGQSL